MDWTISTGALVFPTLGAVAALAFVSKRKTDACKEDPEASKSTLAADKDAKGNPADVQDLKGPGTCPGPFVF
jgi:hypothetical protein